MVKTQTKPNIVDSAGQCGGRDFGAYGGTKSLQAAKRASNGPCAVLLSIERTVNETVLRISVAPFTLRR
jgi:hypothetical protein